MQFDENLGQSGFRSLVPKQRFARKKPATVQDHACKSEAVWAVSRRVSIVSKRCVRGTAFFAVKPHGLSDGCDVATVSGFVK